MMLSAVQAGSAEELLGLWERAVATAPSERCDALLSTQLETLPESLGAYNAALLGLRARLFGAAQPLRSRCAACGATIEFAVDCGVLARALAPASDAAQEQRLEVDGYRITFRTPCVADLRVASAGADRDEFARTLLQRCVLRCEREDGEPCDAEDTPASVADALSQRMESLEPGATVSFDLTCPECGAQWNAPMDCGDVLWSELQARAERLLLEIDALARAYGWSETQVLALSATRRAAYLQLIGSG
jgi:hypothetical protein